MYLCTFERVWFEYLHTKAMILPQSIHANNIPLTVVLVKPFDNCIGPNKCTNEAGQAGIKVVLGIELAVR